MKTSARAIAQAAVLLLLAAPAQQAAVAQRGTVALASQPAPWKGVDAFPKILAGAPPEAMLRINKSLEAANVRVRKSVKQCVADGAGHADWTRTVSVAMKGPRYLSLVARDEIFCGGAHPDNGVLSLVFELDTGALVDLQKLLPGLATTAALDSATDGSKIGTIASEKLSALYREGAKRDGPDPDCVNALKESDLAFIAWPDAGEGGLVIAPTTLPHVVAACGPDVTLSPATLKDAGADPALLEALAAARK